MSVTNQPARMTKIKYKKQGGFQLMERYAVQTPLRPEKVTREADGFCTLMQDGMLHIEAGYVWDGPSTGPFKKFSATKTFMRGSLVHDAMHQLARQNTRFRKFKEQFDDLLQAHCIEDGMWKLRARWVRAGVRKGKIAEPRPILEAP